MMSATARGLLAWAVHAAIAVGLAGCAATSDMEQLQTNESALRGMIANDRQQMDSLQEQVARLNDRLTELEHNGGSGGGGSGSRADAALDARVSKLETQLASMQPAGAATPSIAPAGPGTPGTPGTPEAAASPAARGAEAPADAGASPETAAGAGAPVTSSPSPRTEIASAAPPAAPAPRPPAQQAMVGAVSWRAELDRELATPYSDPAANLYRAGLADIKGARYPQGIVKLQELQHKYPKSELSEPAEYFCANALFEAGKYDQSILQFNDLTMRFPNGKYASAALLREAEAFMKINDRIDARLTLQKLIGDHPNSPEAPQAKSMMQTLASG